MNHKNILFLGQKPLGEKCFQILLESKNKFFKIQAVVSNKTIKVWWKSNTIYKIAKKKNIRFISNNKRNHTEIKKIIKEKKINVIITVQHPWIIPQSIISLVSGFAFNLHNAKLPNYKGYNSCNHAILNAEKKYTCTVHWLIKEIDAGNIAFIKSFPIATNETAYSLYQKANHYGHIVFLQLIHYLMNNKTIPSQRVNEKGTFYSRDSINIHRKIKNVFDPNEIDRKSRAFYFPPFEPAYFTSKGKNFYVLPSNIWKNLDSNKG